jgi:hypothetical protein
MVNCMELKIFSFRFQLWIIVLVSCGRPVEKSCQGFGVPNTSVRVLSSAEVPCGPIRTIGTFVPTTHRALVAHRYAGAPPTRLDEINL